MELRVFEDFLMLAEMRSFSRAAIRRNSTQSALSRRIRALEDWLGATLVDRSANPLKLTRAGEAFHDLAQDSLRGIKHGCEEVLSISAKTISAVSFAVTHSLSLNFFPRWIRDIENDLGSVRMKLMSHDGATCRQAIMSGECHFMISHFGPGMAADFRSSRLKSLSLGQDALVPVAAPAADLVPVARIPGAPGMPTPVLGYAEGSFMGRSLDLFLQGSEQPAHIQTCFESSLAEGLKAMVLEGHGVGWLPRSLVRHELEHGTLVRAGGPEWDVPFEVRLFRPITRLPKSAEKLWSVVSKKAPDLVTCF